MIHEDKVLAFYEEKDQDLDKVLHIFIRVNSQGEPLSHSDLLLSIATAQWEDRDARETIYSFVDEINEEGRGFGFSKDLVLKAGLVMTDAADVGFKVANFNRSNMAELEQNWDRIERAVRISVRLLAAFGFSERTLSANSVLIPIADYLYQRDAGDAFLTHSSEQPNRAAIRRWVMRSLMKSGIWGSGLDTLLARLRRVIRDHPGDTFRPTLLNRPWWPPASHSGSKPKRSRIWLRLRTERKPSRSWPCSMPALTSNRRPTTLTTSSRRAVSPGRGF